ncbi:MAG: SDR family NAD(P)-dependent oxidoreductase [Rikenellaceae bacterium]|jgi:NADP-dependent 3-hydroxy acid dehydrogenase YdfG|nr:SDR family NAD(P)-dependent oxidoreductase [Rikenellaceae bacterium]
MAKIALITGATSGIGEATARALCAEGWWAIVTGRRAERLRQLKAQLEADFAVEAAALSFDVRDRRQCEAALGSLPERFRNVELLVNNAGLALGLEPLHEGDPAQWEQMIDSNVKGLLYVTRIIADGMVARGRGHIVNIGSIAGTQPYLNGAVYCASKHAVHALSQGMRIDLLPHGIRVTEIRPGMVETEFSQVRFGGDEARAAEVYRGVEPLGGEDVAEAIVWAVGQPPHVNIDEIVLTPVAQANAYYTHRSNIG